MGIRKKTRISIVVITCFAGFIANQFSNNLKEYVIVTRNLSSEDTSTDTSIKKKIKSYSSPGSIGAVINTAKMGTGGLQRT